MDGAASIGGVRSGTASFTTPTASISPAKASGANAPDRSQRIDHQPPTLAQIYCQQSARQPGDIISESAGDFVGICMRRAQRRIRLLRRRTEVDPLRHTKLAVARILGDG